MESSESQLPSFRSYSVTGASAELNNLPRRGYHVLSPESECSSVNDIDSPEAILPDSNSQLPSFREVLQGFQQSPTLNASFMLYKELSFDDDLPPLLDWSIQNMLTRNGLLVLRCLFPTFNPVDLDSSELPPVLQWSIQSAAFHFCADKLECIQRGLSSPRNLFTLINRIHRTLARMVNPEVPSDKGTSFVMSGFAAITPENWDEFFAVDRHLMRSVMCVCLALFLSAAREEGRESLATNMSVDSSTPMSQCRFFLKLLVDHAKRLGLHLDIWPQGVPKDTDDEQLRKRLTQQMAERRRLWWSVVVLDRVYFVLDEPTVWYNQIRDLPISIHQRASQPTPIIRLGSLLRSLSYVPVPDPSSITPILNPFLCESNSSSHEAWSAHIEDLYRLCVANDRAVRGCENLRYFEASGVVTHHINAIGAALARHCAVKETEWWCVEYIYGGEDDADDLGMIKLDLDDVGYEDEDEWFDNGQRKSPDELGAMKLALLRRVVMRMEVALAYNEHSLNIPADHETNCIPSPASTFHSRCWDILPMQQSLSAAPFIFIPAIVAVAHSPSHVLESLIQNAKAVDESPLRGVVSAVPNQRTYAMLVRWARARYGGQICWAQTMTLMRRIKGVLRAVDESAEHEEMYHGNRVHSDCADLWCKEANEEARSLSRMVMLNSNASAVVWRAVAMAVIAWGVWNEVGELGQILAQSADPVDVQACRDELMNGVQDVSEWIRRTLNFCGSNEMYWEALVVIRDLVL
ncbi:hypothetical protein BJ742DRAFT_106391 [Cladochytrium replicatum]|nr:hypothetical protein BJ742DRAFT_106391 [Cladochytrium replicatum]